MKPSRKRTGNGNTVTRLRAGPTEKENKMKHSESITKLAAALSKAQAEMPPAPMNSVNPFLKNRFADLGAVITTSRPVLAKHGLSIAQFPVSENGSVGVTSILTHESGEWLEETVVLPLNEERGKSAAQVAGSVVTYLRRYSWSSIIGMYADEDTDGNQPHSDMKSESIQREKEEQTAKKETPKKAVNEKFKAFAAKFNEASKTIKHGLPVIAASATDKEIDEAIAGIDAMLAAQKG
jgi:hypothetical protein